MDSDEATEHCTRSNDTAVIPNAVLDTNVMLSIYSWHDLVEAMERVGKKDPTSSLHDADIQFRAQQLRWGFLLSLFLDEKAWTTTCPFAEFKRKMAERVDPRKTDHDARVGYTTLYAHFVKDLILTRWHACADEEDEGLKGNDVDTFCAKRAATYAIPLITWEGVSHTGAIDNEKTIRKESLQRGVGIATPQEFLKRERFNTRAATKRFFTVWRNCEHDFVQGLGPPTSSESRPGRADGHATENMAFMKGVFLRLARNDWDP